MLKGIGKKVVLGSLSLSLVSIFAGCAVSNEGKVDFRRTNVTHVIQDEKSDKTKTDSITGEETSSDKQKKFQELKFKNFSLGSDKDTRFVEGDSLSLHLRSAYIADFSEDIVTPYVTSAFTRQWGEPIGEIAIVTNAFEYLDGEELDPKDIKRGRVVYYSGNVHKGQFLNFKNMPIYGPLKYQGAPFGFRISILELDTNSEQSKAILQSVAHAGSKAYPPASPVLGILNDIGNSFLSGDQTDTEFSYSMVLDPKSGSSKVNHFTLEVGNYVFIRTEDRTQNIEWDKLVLDENEDKLYWKNNCDIEIIRNNKQKCEKRQEFTEGTYLVVEITKNISNLHVQLAQNNFKDLIASLEEKDKEKATNLQSIKDSLTYASVKRNQIYNFKEAKDLLSSLKDTKENKAQKMTNTEKLLEILANSVGNDGKPKTIDANNTKVDLSADEVDYVMDKLRVIAGGDATLFYSLNTKKIAEAFDKKNNAKELKTLIELIVK
jgi:hypothetical protein